MRSAYWDGFRSECMANSVVFFDPDNGFETKTCHGEKWILHDELSQILEDLPADSIVVVYQHRPFRTWDAVFADLAHCIDYATSIIAVYESNLAFVAVTKDQATARRIMRAIEEYAAAHPVRVSPDLRDFFLVPRRPTGDNHRIDTGEKGVPMSGRSECLCCKARLSVYEPRICPVCGKEFKQAWCGIDAHWRSQHEEFMPYEVFWGALCDGHRRGG